MYRILIVDDMLSMRLFLKSVLMGMHLTCEYVLAPDGNNALDVMRTYHPHLILTDYLMPEMNGVEMYRRARTAGYAGHVIFISSEEREHMRDAVNDPKTAYIQKPKGGINDQEYFRSLLRLRARTYLRLST